MTCRISFVFAYSVVAFQCRNVWKVILLMRSFLSLHAILFRCCLKVLVKCLGEQSKGFCFSFGKLLSIAISWLIILSCLGSLPFSGVTFTVRCSKLKSIHANMNASPQRMPVSLSSCKNVEVFCCIQQLDC